ncbi:MAG: metal-binding protein [Rhodopirellula sp.]|nr:metal-binding protein [Rhodopirellula sp.]
MKKHTLAFGLMAALGFSTTALAGGAAQSIHVYKSPTCGCCGDWIDHLEENGFKVTATDTNDMGRIKADAGLIAGLGSCHTAFISDYVIEGHVPAEDIKRLISEAPRAKGLSVPGMPIGSPGMEMGDRKDHYKVILFNESGQTRIFSEHN